MTKKIWIDIVNPSHPLFFRPLLDKLGNDYEIQITMRERAETVGLAKQLGFHGKIYGKEYENRIKKILGPIYRTITLVGKIKKFDFSISFENSDCIATTKIRNRKSISFLDNDLKFKIKKSFVQTLESKIKSLADYNIIPITCREHLKKYISEKKIITYNGYKEDFYIADFKPNPKFNKFIPFNNYIIIRPEAIGSLYSKRVNSIVPDLLKRFEKEGFNVIYLPRDPSDMRIRTHNNMFIPNITLNGLDLIYFSNAVLTGSGTMAREAACMGKTAVSFFPSEILLSVDQQLVEEGKIFHSRDTKEIVEHVLSNYKKIKKLDTERSKKVKKEILTIINTCIQ